MIYIIIFCITILILILSIIFFIGSTESVSTPNKSIEVVTQGSEYDNCVDQQIQCETDLDCFNKCGTDNNFQCTLIGGNKKICTLPENPDYVCNTKNGGMNLLSTSQDGFEFDCVCSEPEFSSNNGCTKINKNVCMKGNNYTFPMLNNNIPLYKGCDCNEDDYVMMVDKRYNNIPICVKKEMQIFYNDLFQEI